MFFSAMSYHYTQKHSHPSANDSPSPQHLLPVSQDAVCRQRPSSLLCKQKFALINRREVLSWEQEGKGVFEPAGLLSLLQPTNILHTSFLPVFMNKTT